MPRRLTPLLLLSLLSLGLACEKDVREVRRRPDLSSDRSQTANGRVQPVAPSGNPVGVAGNPVTP